MSRTLKGAKGPGYEYGSRRPYNLCGAPPGRSTKRVTHGIERARAKASIRKEATP